MSTPHFLLAELGRLIDCPLVFDEHGLCVLEIDGTILTLRCNLHTITLYGALGDISDAEPATFWLRTMQGNALLVEAMRAAIALIPGTNTLCLMQTIDASKTSLDAFEKIVQVFIEQTHRIAEAWDALYVDDEPEFKESASFAYASGTPL